MAPLPADRFAANEYRLAATRMLAIAALAEAPRRSSRNTGPIADARKLAHRIGTVAEVSSPNYRDEPAPFSF